MPKAVPLVYKQDPELVSYVEELASRVKSGEIRALATVWVNKDYIISTGWQQANDHARGYYHQLHSALHIAAVRMATS